MFSTVIDKLTSAFSKQMLPAAIYPLLITAFFNVALLARTSPTFWQWAKQQTGEKVGTAALNASLCAIALTVLAGMLSTLSTFLRELLEGKHWPNWLCHWLTPLETERLLKFESRLKDVTTRHRTFRSVPRWTHDLSEARVEGLKKKDAAYDGLPETANHALIALREARNQGLFLAVDDLTTVRLALIEVLKDNNTHTDNANARRLDGDHVEFVSLLDYGRSRVAAEGAKVYAERQVSFGEGPVAPTSIGNVAAALSAYGEGRYGLNIDVLWTRMQKALQEDAAFNAVIPDAKAQLDGLILLFWLTGLTTAVWLVVLPFISLSIPLLIIVAVTGPLICTCLYLVAETSYRGFAELVRSAVDILRFKLLEQLHLIRPQGPAQERRLWENVNQWIGFNKAPDSVYYEQPK
jgi:hypothetical protein